MFFLTTVVFQFVADLSSPYSFSLAGGLDSSLVGRKGLLEYISFLITRLAGFQFVLCQNFLNFRHHQYFSRSQRIKFLPLPHHTLYHYVLGQLFEIFSRLVHLKVSDSRVSW